jgi:hypothetical protein
MRDRAGTPIEALQTRPKICGGGMLGAGERSLEVMGDPPSGI